MKIFLKQKDFHFSYFLWIFIKTAFLYQLWRYDFDYLTFIEHRPNNREFQKLNFA